MFQTLLKNKILITVVVLVVGAGIYYFAFSEGSTNNVVNVSAETERQRDMVLDTLNAYQSFSFDKDRLTSSVVYSKLVDNTALVVEVTSGRTDPFAPAGR